MEVTRVICIGGVCLVPILSLFSQGDYRCDVDRKFSKDKILINYLFAPSKEIKLINQGFIGSTWNIF